MVQTFKNTWFSACKIHTIYLPPPTLSGTGSRPMMRRGRRRARPLTNIFICVANPYQDRASDRHDETSTSAHGTVLPACKVILDARSLVPKLSYNPNSKSVHLHGQSTCKVNLFFGAKSRSADLISGPHCIYMRN